MERPKVTPEILTQAAQKLADENGWDAQQVEDIARGWRQYMDGYEFAKYLENHCDWAITVADVDALDCFGSEVRELHRQACIAWAKGNDIQPPLPIGTLTTRGEITGVSQYDGACYLIREHGETNESRRLVVKFEDARAA